MELFILYEVVSGDMAVRRTILNIDLHDSFEKYVKGKLSKKNNSDFTRNVENRRK